MGEAEVFIDGVKLTEAQVMAMRVALSSFTMRLTEDGLGDDEHGKTMTENYIHHCNAVAAMLIQGGNRPDRLAARQKAWAKP